MTGLLSQVEPEASDSFKHESELTSITVGSLRIDFRAGGIWLHDQWVDVTVLEYKLLTHLARNLGRVIGYSELLEAVWGCAETNTTTQLKNCVWRLRQKIEIDCEAPIYIVTARGRGYYMPANGESSHHPPLP